MGVYKAHVYGGKSYTLEELKAAVMLKTKKSTINEERKERVEANFQKQFQTFIYENGYHLRNVIFGI